MSKPAYAGLRYWVDANRRTGTTVGLYNSDEAGLDSDGGAWTLVCEEHSNTLAVATLAVARDLMPVPDEWCEACGNLLTE